MEKQELFSLIESLQPHISALISNSTTKLTNDEINTLVKIYKEILPGQRLNTGCGDCLKYALIYSHSFYERETSKITKSQAEQTKVEIEKPKNTTKKGKTTK